jgi:glycerol-3-phosphate dehydrogenase (NAD(P)+)
MRASVIGDGAWGTTLAMLLHANGHRVSLWSHDSEYARVMRETRSNPRFLPGVPIPPAIDITADPAAALAQAEMAVAAVPAQHLRAVFERVAPSVPPSAFIVSVAKGVEIDTLLRPTQVLSAFLPGRPLAVLSGPSHAEEVSRGLPASVVAAAQDPRLGATVQRAFMSESLRIYTQTDVIGVELGGALKNVIAIAAGILEGLAFGDNAKAALLTRGLTEITRLGKALGAEPLTFSGLSGLGDLLTTCFSPYSRNRAVGLAVGRGEPLPQAVRRIEGVAEGVDTTRSACALADRAAVEMPISREVYRVLFEGKNPRQAVRDLMVREPRSEREFG